MRRKSACQKKVTYLRTQWPVGDVKEEEKVKHIMWLFDICAMLAVVIIGNQ